MISNKIYNLFLLILFIPIFLFSTTKSVEMSVSAQELFLDDTFELTIAVNNFDADKVKLQTPIFSGLTKINGPFQSNSSYSINGKSTSTISLKYKFAPKKPGKIKIEPAIIIEGSKKYKSNPITLTVYKNNEKISKNNEKKGKDIFLKTYISNKSPYANETIKIDYVLFLNPNLRIKMPSAIETPKMEGFVKKEIDINNTALVPKIIDGIKYNTLAIKSTYLTPTTSGIDTLTSLIISVPVEGKKNRRKRYDPFGDDFFNDDIFSGFVKYDERTIRSYPATITVKDIPRENQPESFDGLVGNFTVISSIDKDSLNVNDALTLKTIIKGKGNLLSIEYPKATISDDFEAYEPKKKINSKTPSVSGTVSFEQILIPRIVGIQNITTPDFSFFNPASNKYVTIPGKTYNIKVKSNGKNYASNSMPSNFTKKEVKLIGKDIRYIKKGNFSYYKIDNANYSFKNFYIYLLFAILLPLFSLIARNIFNKKQGNSILIRKRKAYSKSLQKLKKVSSVTKKEDAYKIFLDTIYNYLADQFNISASGIVLEDIILNLSEQSVTDRIINNLNSFVQKCTSIQYTPIKDLKAAVKEDYEKCKIILNDIEHELN